MNDPNEPAWQRDKRLREEESRMVRLEEQLRTIDARVVASHELLLEERGARRRAEEGFGAHMEDDDRRFSSIDSRLQGMQAQLSTSNDTLKRIETTLNVTEGRVKHLEDGEADRTAVQRFLASTWTHVIGGGGIAGLLIVIYALAR